MIGLKRAADPERCGERNTGICVEILHTRVQRLPSLLRAGYCVRYIYGVENVGYAMHLRLIRVTTWQPPRWKILSRGRVQSDEIPITLIVTQPQQIYDDLRFVVARDLTNWRARLDAQC